MVNASTKYYRKNRQTNKIRHCCPHCDYATSNTRIQLVNHINAKHVEEKDRPYQCDHCNRGFAQKAHLETHLSIVHNIEQLKLKVSSISYIIEPTNIVPRSMKTKARREYYFNHGVFLLVQQVAMLCAHRELVAVLSAQEVMLDGHVCFDTVKFACSSTNSKQPTITPSRRW